MLEIANVTSNTQTRGHLSYSGGAWFSRNSIANQMPPAQIAEAERLAAEWKPGDCGAEAGG